MARRANSGISTRKLPQQARSNALIAAVLEAATQVLRNEGAARFTTARVAERAGVSIGSLYQYFPNKAAILFRLQRDEWRDTAQLLRTILEERTRPPLQRLRALVHAFLHSECAEAQVRLALDDVAPRYRDAPEAGAVRAAGATLIHDFLQTALPDLDDAVRDVAADLVEATLTGLGSRFSEVERSDAQIAAYADAMADMFCAYLAALSAGRLPAAEHGA